MTYSVFFNFEVLCGGCERRQCSNHNFRLYPFSVIIVRLELGMPLIAYTSNLFGCWLYLSIQNVSYFSDELSALFGRGDNYHCRDLGYKKLSL